MKRKTALRITTVLIGLTALAGCDAYRGSSAILGKWQTGVREEGLLAVMTYEFREDYTFSCNIDYVNQGMEDISLEGIYQIARGTTTIDFFVDKKPLPSLRFETSGTQLILHETTGTQGNLTNGITYQRVPTLLPQEEK